MSKKLFLLVMLVLAFLQGTVLPAVFLEGLPLFFFSLYGGVAVLPAVFLAGIIFDLVQTSALGVTSVIFILAAFFPLRHPISIFVFFILLNFARSQALSIVFPLLPTLFAAALGVFLNARAGEDLSGKLRV